MPNLQQKIAAATRELAETQTASETYEARRQAKDRSFIANAVVVSFLFLCVAVVATALLGDWTKKKEPLEFTLMVLTSVLLPVVTLVIGYYFGKKSGDS